MEKINKEELNILSGIMEGCDNLVALAHFTNVEETKLMKLLNGLEKKDLVSLIKKYDNHYKKDFWIIDLTKKSRVLLKVK